MLRKPLRGRDGHLIDTRNRDVVLAAAMAPLATPEEAGYKTRFEIGRNIGRRLGKSLGRFERRHSLGKEKERKIKVVEVAKDHHSAVEYTEHSSTSNEI